MLLKMADKVNSSAVEPDDYDVLMGRGKRVFAWPGNIYFRQIVIKHKGVYRVAARARKVEIAKEVIQEIQTAGGRFLKEESDGSWVEIDYDRAVEKACQALREKEKPNPPKENPFSNKDNTLSLKNKILKKKILKRRPQSPEISSTSDDDADTRSSSTESKMESDENDSDDEESQGEQQSPVEVKIWNHAEMMDQLKAYKILNGHCAIPPRRDSTLSCWCTVQRQLRREIDSGYREATEEEKTRIKRMEDFGFCWDYGEWLWNRQFEEYKKYLASIRNKSPRETPLPDQPLLLWIQEQRRLSKSPEGLRLDRRERLLSIGVKL